MSDMNDDETNLKLSLEEHMKLRLAQLQLHELNPELIARMDRSAALAFQGKLNPPDFVPLLSQEQKKWLTMDRFSKRELGQTETKPAPNMQPPVTAQLAPGQRATIIGPSTIHGGEIQIEPNDGKQQ